MKEVIKKPIGIYTTLLNTIFLFKINPKIAEGKTAINPARYKSNEKCVKRLIKIILKK